LGTLGIHSLRVEPHKIFGSIVGQRTVVLCNYRVPRIYTTRCIVHRHGHAWNRCCTETINRHVPPYTCGGAVTYGAQRVTSAQRAGNITAGCVTKRPRTADNQMAYSQMSMMGNCACHSQLHIHTLNPQPHPQSRNGTIGSPSLSSPNA
jgi:hypothetical protein